MRISDWSSDVCSSYLAPVAAPEFTVPGTNPITPRLIGGAMLFGIGWGIAGLCPGPAIADLALRPLEAGVFVLAMLAGFALHRLVDRPAPPPRSAEHTPEPQSLIRLSFAVFCLTTKKHT